MFSKNGLRIRKVLHGIMLLGTVISAFGVGNMPVARAQALAGDARSLSMHSQASTAEDALNTALQTYISQGNPGEDFKITELHIGEAYAYAIAEPYDRSTGQRIYRESFVPLLAQQNSPSNWSGIAPGLVSDTEFTAVLMQIPNELMDESTRAFLLIPEVSQTLQTSPNPVLQGISLANFTGYKLPWGYQLPGKAMSKGGSGHENQIDFDIQGWAARGDVYASRPGTVVFIKESQEVEHTSSDCSFSDWKQTNLVVVQHSTNEYSWYVHLQYNSVPVMVGQTIGYGTKIGTEGATGYACGIHLHFMASTGHLTWTDPNDPNAAPWATGITAVDFDEVSYADLTVGQTYISQNSAGAAPGLGKYDDTHAGWTYGGTWIAWSGAGPYNNTDHYTSTVGSTASFTFTGSQFNFSYVTNTDRGNIEVTVDGGAVATINAKSPLTWQKTYTSPVFSSGTHTAVFKFTGGGTYADVDAIEIVSPDLIAPDGVGSLSAVTGTANGSINLSWTAPANDAGNPASGPVSSYLVRYSLADITNETEWNGATAVTSGLPTPGAPGSGQSMTIPGLTPGTTYYIAVRGQDTGFNLGPIVTASAVAKAPAPLGVGKYDDTHTGWTYVGGWQTYNGSGPYNSTNHYTTTAGDQASFTFNGSQFILSYVAYSNRGSFEVWVDGGLVTTVNAYSSTLVWQKAYTSPVFASRTHTVVFKFMGPAGTYGDVDAIQILP